MSKFKQIAEDKFDDIVNQLQKFDGIARKNSKEVLMIKDIRGDIFDLILASEASGPVPKSQPIAKAKLAQLLRQAPEGCDLCGSRKSRYNSRVARNGFLHRKGQRLP